MRRDRGGAEGRKKIREEGCRENSIMLTSPSIGTDKATVKTGSKKGTMSSNINEERGAYNISTTQTPIISSTQNVQVFFKTEMLRMEK